MAFPHDLPSEPRRASQNPPVKVPLIMGIEDILNIYVNPNTRRYTHREFFGKILVNPSQARYMLSFQQNNRKVRKATVEKYYTDMVNDEWKNSTLNFNSQGFFVNGEHRLLAQIKADKTLHYDIMVNDDDDARVVYDTPLARTAADNLQMSGVKNSSVIGSAIKILNYYRKYPNGAWSNLVKMSVIQTSNNYDGNSENWDWAGTIAKRVNFKVKKINCGSFTAFIILALEKGHTKNSISEFSEKLRDGYNLTKGDPILVCRDLVMDGKVTKRTKLSDLSGQAAQRAHLELYIRAFNLYLEGKTVKNIKIMTKQQTNAELPGILFAPDNYYFNIS